MRSYLTASAAPAEAGIYPTDGPVDPVATKEIVVKPKAAK